MLEMASTGKDKFSQRCAIIRWLIEWLYGLSCLIILFSCYWFYVALFENALSREKRKHIYLSKEKIWDLIKFRSPNLNYIVHEFFSHVCDMQLWWETLLLETIKSVSVCSDTWLTFDYFFTLTCLMVQCLWSPTVNIYHLTNVVIDCAFTLLLVDMVITTLGENYLQSFPFNLIGAWILLPAMNHQFPPVTSPIPLSCT